MHNFDTEPFALEYHQKRLLAFKGEDVIKNNIVFAGCSITEFGKWNELLNVSSVINRGIAGDNSFGLLKRIEGIINLQPSKLFISIGINDIAKNIPIHLTAQNICSSVKLMKKGSPETKIFVHSILPTNSINRQNRNEIVAHYNKNDKVLEINAALKKISTEIDFTFIDLSSLFQDDDKNLKIEFANQDGLHLNGMGYEIWASYLNENYFS